jgi:hypothetical protein
LEWEIAVEEEEFVVEGGSEGDGGFGWAMGA